MNKMFVAMAGSLVALAAMVVLVRRPAIPLSNDGDNQPPLMFFCAASNRGVMEEILSDYREETGRQVDVQYGPSQTLLAQLEASRTGDLYLPADGSYLELGREKGLIDEVLPVARMQGVIAVKKGNPLSINSFEDLLRSDVRLVQANPDAAAIGKVTRELLQRSGHWKSLDQATTAYRTTVTEVASDVLVGAADAGIVYDAVLHTYPDLTYIELAELSEAGSDIGIGVVTSTEQPARALHFARYVSARDRGLRHYQDHGFRVARGDRWAEVPELRIFAGSMLRPALEDTVASFQAREGVEVTTVYNGCGILVAQMKTGPVPDAYFACDTEFMQQVPDLFPESIDVTQNELVILVEKGNPFNVASLADLTNPDIRVGIGHEKQCAMGWLTQQTLREGGLQNEFMQNVDTQSPTGDLLVNKLLTGSLDAAVAYYTNAAGHGDRLDIVRIADLECRLATQPYAVSPKSPFTQTAGRLFQQICSAESQDAFAAEGFIWKLDATNVTADD